MKTLKDLKQLATRYIEEEDTVAYEVAVEHCQQLGNVKRLAWFHQAVMLEIAAESPRYQHLYEDIQ